MPFILCVQITYPSSRLLLLHIMISTLPATGRAQGPGTYASRGRLLTCDGKFSFLRSSILVDTQLDGPISACNQYSMQSVLPSQY